MPKRVFIHSNCPDVNFALSFIKDKSNEFQKKYKRSTYFDFFISFSDAPDNIFDFKKTKKQIIAIIAYFDPTQDIKEELEFFNVKKP